MQQGHAINKYLIICGKYKQISHINLYIHGYILYSNIILPKVSVR